MDVDGILQADALLSAGRPGPIAVESRANWKLFRARSRLVEGSPD
jgi:hypothetical protein